MLPLGSSSGGLDALRGRSSSVDPIVSLTNSVTLLTTSVDKLNDAVIDMVDVGEDSTEQPATSSGRKTRRRRQSQINYKRDHDSSWLRIRTPEERALDKRLQDMDNRGQRRVQFSSFDSAKNQEEMVAVGNMIKSSFDGVKKIFDRLVSPLEELVSNNKKAAATVGAGVGLAILGVTAADALGSAGQAAADAWNRGAAAGEAGRQRLDAAGPRSGNVPNANPLRPNNNLTPEQQQDNRRAIEENRPVTPDEEARIRRQYNSNSTFSTSNDAEPSDDFIQKIIQQLDGGSKDDATPDLVPYYNQDNLNPREYETPAFAPALMAPGAGVAAGGAGAGGIIGAAPGPNQRGNPAGAIRELQRLLEGLTGIMSPPAGAARRMQQAEEARREAAATQEWNRRSAEMNRTPGPAIQESASVTAPTGTESIPTPQAPVIVPGVNAPLDVPTPQAPTNIPSISVPGIDPIAVRPPVVVPMPARPAATPTVQQPAIVQNPAAPGSPAPAIPPPPPAPPPAPPLQPSRPAPVVVMQAPQPPPYIPPVINQPRATGSGNIGRGVGFSPPPPSPMSPTSRTPSYPTRNF